MLPWKYVDSVTLLQSALLYENLPIYLSLTIIGKFAYLSFFTAKVHYV